jgi:hypothetical protein
VSGVNRTDAGADDLHAFSVAELIAECRTFKFSRGADKNTHE